MSSRMKNRILCLVTSGVSTYIVGSYYGTSTYNDKATVELSDVVQMKIMRNPETGRLDASINPFLACDSFHVPVRSHLAIGEAKEEIAEAYKKWKKANDNHKEIWSQQT